MRTFIGRTLILYYFLAISAGCVDIVWNQFSLANALHAPHFSFLVTAGALYIIYTLAALIGYALSAGYDAQSYISDKFPL